MIHKPSNYPPLFPCSVRTKPYSCQAFQGQILSFLFHAGPYRTTVHKMAEQLTQSSFSRAFEWHVLATCPQHVIGPPGPQFLLLWMGIITPALSRIRWHKPSETILETRRAKKKGHTVHLDIVPAFKEHTILKGQETKGNQYHKVQSLNCSPEPTGIWSHNKLSTISLNLQRDLNIHVLIWLTTTWWRQRTQRGEATSPGPQSPKVEELI